MVEARLPSALVEDMPDHLRRLLPLRCLQHSFAPVHTMVLVLPNMLERGRQRKLLVHTLQKSEIYEMREAGTKYLCGARGDYSRVCMQQGEGRGETSLGRHMQ